MSDQQRRANTATRINDPTHARIKEHNRASETLSATIDRALDALERESDVLELAYQAMGVHEGDPTPIIQASDGPRLLLADGSVVYPMVKNADGVDIPFICYNQGACRYGFEDQGGASIAFTEDTSVEFTDGEWDLNAGVEGDE